jgi:two-component system, LytTR family, response regulator LytT
MRGIKILVVDDEVLIAEHLKDILISLGFENIKLAHNQQQALTSIAVFNPEIILLDIRMESELVGIGIAQKVAKMYKIPFIFITAHSDKEIIQKALQTKPAGYITKPVKKMDVYAAITIAIKNLEIPEEKLLIFKDGHAIVKLSIDEIFYAKGEGNYIDIVTAGKKYTIRNSLDWFMGNMPEDQFVRIHRSYVVNIKKIDKQTSNNVYIKGNAIPVSRNMQIDLTRI